jgi:glucose/arabinose dehydrogenase
MFPTRLSQFLRCAYNAPMRNALLAVCMLLAAFTRAAPACDGDCNGDGTVTIDELLLAVNAALADAPPSACAAADRDGNGTISVDELIAAVDRALHGCAGERPTPTITPGDACVGVPSFPGVPATTALVAEGLVHPVTISAAPSDAHRIFVLEQEGRIRIIADGALLPDPFLAIEGRVSCCTERGLLGLAFPPDFATSGRFFVDYTNLRGDTVIARYRVSADADRADPDTEQILLTIAQPFANHNGGQLAFGPDGYLYVGMGDGGSAGDPMNNAQSDDALLGKLLRIDTNVPDAGVDGRFYAVPPDNPHAERGAPLGLVWAKGLRNPWRFSFDTATGDLYIADVGQDRREEIDVQPAASRGGENYGWRVFEGSQCYDPRPLQACPSPPTGYTMPVFDYGHAIGCSITGGFVYRGCALPDLRGQYFFSDYCTAFLHTVQVTNGTAHDLQDRTTQLAPGGGRQINQVVSFGEDAAGELYIADYDGEIYKIVPALR